MRLREDRGQATVQLALVLPLVVVLLGGILWVAQVVLLQVQLEHGAREGARAAAVEPANAHDAARRAVAAVDGDMVVEVSVGSEFVEVRVRDRVAGVPLIGVGARELSAEVVMFREDHIIP